MNTQYPNYAEINLYRYLRKIRAGKLGHIPFEESGFKLLTLLFAYKRKENGLHLRWHRAKSNYLACLTVDELAEKKKTDPILIGIHEALDILSDNSEEAIRKLLAIATIRINENSNAQSARAKTPREPNPVIKSAMECIRLNKCSTPKEIIDCVISKADNHGEYRYSEGYFDYEDLKDPRILKSISLPSLRNVITKLNK